MKKFIYVIALFTSVMQAQVGIGNTDPKTAIDVTGALSLRQGTAINLANGVNNNISLGTNPSSFYRITGPTAAFSISGIIPVTTADGQVITLENTTAQNFTITHDAVSTAANRIYCPGNTNFNLSGQYSTITLTYNASQTRWIVIGSTDNPYGKNIQSVVGTTNTNINTDIFTNMPQMSITFTPKHDVVFVNFGASGDVNIGTGSPQGYVKFRLLKDGVVVGGTVSLVTDYDSDDIAGEFIVAAWNAQFNMYPVNVTAGTSTTISIQWMRDGFAMEPVRNRIVADPDISHRNITIFD
ncbi:hypothetical protein [Flavobacterium sp.]|jgi:hypothetical protein|uniref:hypothetical protein n=1 Tax=Flavobacterium sp. TaxID=239 RepID=UPI0037BE6200